MYRTYYEMKKEAFGNLPELNLFFNSRTHQQAWRYLVSGVRAAEPYLLVAGDYGMGKTLLCMMLMRMLKRLGSYPAAYIADPHTDYAAILAEIAAALGLLTPTYDATATHALLIRFFKEHEHSHGCFIVIDDAHELDPSVLERLRALTNINSNGRFPFRLVLFAHTMLLDMLRDPSLVALGQRIRSRCLLAPLDLEEVREYIYYRLYKSGSSKAPSFTDDAIQEIFLVTKGIPRLINTLAHACLAEGAAQGLEVISHGIVVAAVQKTGLIPQEQKPQIQVLQRPRVTATQEEDDISELVPLRASDTKLSAPNDRRKKRVVHAAEPSRPLFIPLCILALMSLVVVGAAGWEYYRWHKPTEQTESLSQPVNTPQDTREIPDLREAPTTTALPSPSVPETQIPHEAVPTSEKTTDNIVAPAPSGVATVPEASPQPAVHDGNRGAEQKIGTPQQSSKDTTSSEAQGYIVSVPLHKSVVTIALDTKQNTVWQRREQGISPKEVSTLDWKRGDGLFIVGMDPRQGAFFFHQMNLIKDADAAVLINQWKNKGILSGRELIPVLAVASPTQHDDSLRENADELPAVVAAWADAWRQKNVDRMMSFYSDIVTIYDMDKDKPFIFTKAELTKRRSEVFAKCGAISLELSDPVCVVDPRNPDHSAVIFSQRFQSQTYADEGEKALFLRLEQESTGTARQWKIIGQLWVPWKTTQNKR